MQTPTSAKGGKYLTFEVMNETYGLEILKVREIIGMIDITPVPQTPEFVKGVINLRGKVIAVIDLRNKFKLECAEHSRETCMIIVDLKGKQIGIIVDAVRDVLNIIEENIDDTPSFGVQLKTEFITGIGKVDNKVIILLNIDQVLTSDEFVSLSSIES